MEFYIFTLTNYFYFYISTVVSAQVTVQLFYDFATGPRVVALRKCTHIHMPCADDVTAHAHTRT